jgi:uncharacterized protein (DUF697 family)
MTRKPLPKAIIQPLGGPRSGAAAGSPSPIASRPAAALPHDAAEPEPTLAVSAAPIANDPLPALSPQAQQLAAKRLALARKIVARHRAYAAAGGLVPLPIINVAGVTTIILRMVKQLSDLYGVPFERDRTRSFVLGLIGGAAPTGLGVTTAATLAFAIPAPALAGLAVSALTAGALTNGIGRVYIEQFEAANR